MNHRPDDDKLHDFAHRALRELPPRRAPRSLEQRVLAEIERRAARPWWRKSFHDWPIAARAAFILVSSAGVKLAVMVGAWVMAGFETAEVKTAFSESVAWLHNVARIADALRGSGEILLRNIPPLWLYSGCILFAVAYVTLFGLGAAAIKALRAARIPASQPSASS